MKRGKIGQVQESAQRARQQPERIENMAQLFLGREQIFKEQIALLHLFKVREVDIVITGRKGVDARIHGPRWSPKQCQYHGQRAQHDRGESSE